MENKKISIIVAIAENLAIGKDNGLLCRLSDDLKLFKRTTQGHTVIMGKNTFLSLPNGPLPNRRNIVISDADDEFQGCEMASTIKDAIDKCDEGKENFIIGGASIYNQFYPLVQKMYLTKIHQSFDGDAFFPEINYDDWLLLSEEHYNANDKNEFPFTFIVYERKSKKED